MCISKRLKAAAIAFLPLAVLQGCATVQSPSAQSASSNNNKESEQDASKRGMEQAEGLIKLASEMQAHGKKSERATWLSLYEQAAAVSGDNPAAVVRLAEAYADAGMTSKALKTYRSLLAKNASDGPALTGLGLILIKTGALDKGIESLEKAAPLVNTPLAFSRLGVAYTQAGRLKEAREALERAYRLTPGDLDIATNLALAWALDGDYDNAVNLMRRVTASPHVQEHHRHNLVLVLALAGEEDQARQAARQVFTQSDFDDLLARAAKIRGLSEPKARAKALGTVTPSPPAQGVKTPSAGAGSDRNQMENGQDFWKLL